MKTRTILLFCLLFLLTQSCQKPSGSKRKIKLTDQATATRTDDQLTTTIHLEPTLRRAIAVMFFENQTGDESLEWLRKGLTEMFIRALSQSQYVSVLSTDRLYEILERLDKSSSSEAIDMDMAAIVAQEANVEALLTGNISRSGDSLRINVKLHEPNQGQIIQEASVEGPGLDNIFGMVDHLTQEIKSNLQLALSKDETSRGIADLSTSSLEAWRYYTAGLDLLYKVLFTDAIAQFQKAVELDSTFVSAYLYLSSLLYNQGELQQGHEAFQKLLSLRNKATPQEKYQMDIFEAALINRDTRRTIQASHQWLEQYPNDRDANFNLATLYYNLQKWDRAIHYYRKVLDIDPKYKLAYNMLGYLYANTGDYSNAITTLNKYKELAPDEPNPYDSMGEIFLYQGNYKQAEKHFKQAIEVNENFIHSLLHLGDTYLDKGEYKKALRMFNESLEKVTDPTDKANVHTQIGLTQWRLGQTDKAIMNLKKSLQYQDEYRIITWLNEVYKDHNDDTGRIQLLKQNYDSVKVTVKTFPTRLTSLANLSLWYDINVKESISIVNEILKTTDNPTAQMWGRFFLALLYLKTDQLDEYKKLSEDFTQEFIEIIKTVRDIPLTYSTWRNYSIFNQYAYHCMDEGIEKYNQLITFCLDNELKMTEMAFRSLLADLYFHTGKREKAKAQLKMAGIPEENNWAVVGPFDNQNGFNKQFPPEKKTKLNQSYKGKTQSMTWQRADDGFHDGYIDLKKILKQYNWSVGYGLIYANSPEKRDVQIRIGTNDAAKIWLNDELVWRFNIGRDAIFDDDIVNVSLKPGLNKILIKVCNRISLWGFYFRMTDEKGNGIPDIQFVSPDALEGDA